jgi:hypothetical protein
VARGEFRGRAWRNKVQTRIPIVKKVEIGSQPLDSANAKSDTEIFCVALKRADKFLS